MGCGRYETEEYYGFYDALEKNGKKIESIRSKIMHLSYKLEHPAMQRLLADLDLLQEYNDYSVEKEEIHRRGKHDFPNGR